MPPWLSLERALALAGLAGLLLVGLLSVGLVLTSGGGEEETQALAPTPSPSPTPTPAPTPKPLTPEQRAERRAAVEQLREQGFEPVRLKQYDPEKTLRVLLGEPTAASRAAGVPEGRRAFFFVGDAFVGTDAPEVSSDLELGRRTERAVTLRYGLETLEDTAVRFRWDGTALVPQSTVPSVLERQF